MRPPAALRYARVEERIHSVITAALRADPMAICEVSEDERLDPYSRAFLREARRLVLAGAAGLTTVLSEHRPGVDRYDQEICQGCGTPDCLMLKRITDVLAAYSVQPVAVDRAEAWRRADAWFGGSRPLVVEEFEDGFAAYVPGGNGPVLVVDRRTGVLSRWPVMSRETLADHYRRHLCGEL